MAVGGGVGGLNAVVHLHMDLAVAGDGGHGGRHAGRRLELVLPMYLRRDAAMRRNMSVLHHLTYQVLQNPWEFSPEVLNSQV